MLSVGCSSPTRAAPSDLDGLAALVYPDAAERGDDLDVFVTRRGSVLDLQNMSTRRIGFEQIWLNRAYVSTIDGLNVGEQATLSLDWFRNRHGETYPRGTFLAPERNLPLVLAELFDPGSGRRHRLIVRLGRD